MPLIREALRPLVQLVAMAIGGRRLGVALLLVGALVAVAASVTVTTAVPVVIYPFL